CALPISLDVKKGNIESSSSKIVDKDVTFLLRLSGSETVGNGGSGWLVDDTKDVHARDGTSILGGLTLVVVEVSWNSDDSLLDGLSKLGLGNLLHLDENHSGDLLWRVYLGLTKVLNLNVWVALAVDDLEWPGGDILLDRWVVESASDKTLSIEDSVPWVQGSLVLCSITEELLLFVETDERRCDSVTLLVGNCRNGKSAFARLIENCEL